MGNKAIWQSKTFWGAIVTLVAISFPGIWMLLGLSDDYGMTADKIVMLLGQVVVIYGRFSAGGVSITGK